MDTPETRYAKSGDLHIAYQVVGNGELDLVCIPGFVSHLEAWWELPPMAHFLRRLAAFSRLILFDKRGTGLSDRSVGIPTLEERMDDVRAGSKRAVLFGWSEGGAMSILFAAALPHRTRACSLLDLRPLAHLGQTTGGASGCFGPDRTQLGHRTGCDDQ
jgi:pimeloyl-ACP methyl ester carboxylesterase